MVSSGDNPFRPGFGTSPPVLVGRDEIVAELADSLRIGAWSPMRATVVSGLRGVGKTVLLNALEDAAKSAGWVVIAETAREGMVESLATDTLPRILSELDPSGERRRVVAAVMSGFGITTQATDEHPVTPGLRSQLRQLTELVEDGGVLITVDEVHHRALPDMRELTTALQHLLREEREIAFVGAGLRAGISEVLQDPGVTFLRRAHRIEITGLSAEQTRQAIADPIRTAGRAIDDATLDYAVRAAQGYPFLTQMIGSLAWEHEPSQHVIDMDAVRAAAQSSLATMHSNVHEPSVAALSPTDRRFLEAMAADDGPSTTADVGHRLGVERNYVSVYRQRLIDAGMIVQVGHGRLAFTMPYLRSYLLSSRTADDATLTSREYPPPPDDLEG